MTRWTRSPEGQKPLSPTFFLGASLMLVALLFGGASRLHAAPLAIVELASLPVLLWVAARLVETGEWRRIGGPLAILALVALIPLAQLIPLPRSVWAGLPGREAVAAASTLGGLGDIWRPFTLAPHETVKSCLALLPPAAMFIATARLSSRERRLVVGIVMFAVALNLIFGIGQVAVGGRAYLYESTNRGYAVGLFANRNHYAMLMVASLPLASTLLIAMAAGRRSPMALLVVSALMIMFLVILGVVMSRSRAATGLLLPAILASVYLLVRAGGRGSKALVLGLGAVAAIALAGGALFGLQPLLDQFGAKANNDIRFSAAPEILRQSLQFLPFGSGVGSFEQVYQSFEPVRMIGREFLNHAHNDYLELFLEAGLVAVVPLVLFAAWWGGAVLRAFKSQGSGADLALAGATITSCLLLHSLVDYPLRTPALATLFAFGCGLLVLPNASRHAAPAKRSGVTPKSLKLSS